MASQLAERFNTSQLSCVLKILEINTNNQTLLAKRELETGVETDEAHLPCLITVEKTHFHPRIPNLKSWKASRTAEIIRYNSKTIPQLDCNQIGDPGSPTKVPRTYPPEVGETGMIISEGSPEKDVDRLITLLRDVL